MPRFKSGRSLFQMSLALALGGCTHEPADLKAWQHSLNTQTAPPLPAWPNTEQPYALDHDTPAFLTLFSPEARRPESAEQALVFYPIAQLRYVGHISTPDQGWAVIYTPSGIHLASQGSLLGLEHWSLERIDQAALTLMPRQPDAEPLQLPLSAAPP